MLLQTCCQGIQLSKFAMCLEIKLVILSLKGGTYVANLRSFLMYSELLPLNSIFYLYGFVFIIIVLPEQ